ncbi:MAG TPA: hypothetical protein VFH73_27830 [Polyangia bacterium]|nr:hypothetical protein [Polyangia bacterium]
MIQLDRGLLARITLLWFACCAAALLVDPHAWLISWRGLTEGILWLVILSLPACTRQVPEWIAGFPHRHRRFLAAVLAAVLFGQLAGWEPERTFPLVSWRMFSSKRVLQTLTFFDYVGDTSDGKHITLNPPRLFPSINHTVMMGLANLAEETGPQSTVDEQATGDAQRLRSALRAIGRMHNRLNPTAPVGSVSLVRCTLDARAPAADRHVQRQRVWTVPVAGEP